MHVSYLDHPQSTCIGQKECGICFAEDFSSVKVFSFLNILLQKFAVKTRVNPGFMKAASTGDLRETCERLSDREW